MQQINGHSIYIFNLFLQSLNFKNVIFKVNLNLKIANLYRNTILGLQNFIIVRDANNNEAYYCPVFCLCYLFQQNSTIGHRIITIEMFRGKTLDERFNNKLQSLLKIFVDEDFTLSSDLFPRSIFCLKCYVQLKKLGKPRAFLLRLLPSFNLRRSAWEIKKKNIF